jgi:hypothetical protein
MGTIREQAEHETLWMDLDFERDGLRDPQILVGVGDAHISLTLFYYTETFEPRGAQVFLTNKEVDIIVEALNSAKNRKMEG